jgi:hypothetical protein
MAETETVGKLIERSEDVLCGAHGVRNSIRR